MKRLKFILGMVLFSSFVVASCENDLKDVERVSASAKYSPVNTSKVVEIIYSDSAIVKARMLAPLLDQHPSVDGKSAFDEMKKGVTIIFIDQNQKESSRIVADYGLRRGSTNNQIVELRRNVVGTNVAGDVFKSDELIWDEQAKKIYSNKQVIITQKNGNIIYGTSFISDENFVQPEILGATGNFQSPGL